MQTHLTFGREFTEAVEQKQVAQQDAERARYLVEKAEHVKQAAVTTAEGDAVAAELLAKAFKVGTHCDVPYLFESRTSRRKTSCLCDELV